MTTDDKRSLKIKYTVPVKFINIAAGPEIILALGEDGRVYEWYGGKWRQFPYASREVPAPVLNPTFEEGDLNYG